MTAPPRKTKLYRKKMWLALCSRKVGFQYVWEKREHAESDASSGDRIIRVLVTELPKAAGRGEGK